MVWSPNFEVALWTTYNTRHLSDIVKTLSTPDIFPFLFSLFPSTMSCITSLLRKHVNYHLDQARLRAAGPLLQHWNYNNLFDWPFYFDLFFRFIANEVLWQLSYSSQRGFACNTQGFPALEAYVKPIFSEHAGGTMHFYRIVNIFVSLLHKT